MMLAAALYVFLAYRTAAMTGDPVYHVHNLTMPECQADKALGEQIWREHFSDHPHPGFVCRPEDSLKPREGQ
jgi:hypothetical protein